MKKNSLTFVLIVFFTIFDVFIVHPQEILWWYDLKDSAFGQACAGDIDNDGYYEIVFGCYRNDSCVYALNSEDGSLLWKYNTSTTTGEGCNDVAPLIFDVNNDGLAEVIVPSSCNPTTFCFNGSDGSILWKSSTRGSDSPPTIGDIDGDGALEILHGEFGGYVICLDAKTGKRKWEILVHSKSWIQTAPTLVDLDNDGILDFTVATWCLDNNDTNWIYAFRGYDQKLLWKKPISGRVYHGISIADLDGDNNSELIFGDYSGKLNVLKNATGNFLWTYYDKNFYYIGSPVTIADLDDDGKCEIIFATAFSIVSLKNNGELFWEYILLGDSPSFRGVALSDFDNDAFLDVVFGTMKGKVIILNGTTGNLIGSVDLQAHLGKEFSIDHAPLIADFNKDNKPDIFIVGGKTTYPDFTNNYGRAYLISYGSSASVEWKMFQYDIHRTSSLCQKINTSNLGRTPKYQEIQLLDDYEKINILIKNSNDFELNLTLLDFLGRVVMKQNKLIVNGPEYIFSINKQALSNGIFYLIIFTRNYIERIPIITLKQ